MAVPDPAEPRFTRVSDKAGHYESFYLRASNAAERLGIWIRYTVHKRPHARPDGSLWVTLFDGAADGPAALKATRPGPESEHPDWIRVGESRLASGEAVGSAEAGGRRASWDLRFESREGPLFHLPRGWMYGAPIPRTKLLSPHPAARFSGSMELDGRRLELDGWPGMVGHNWGAQHAERWVWLHGLGFADASDATWLDAAIGRVRVGPVTTPWIGNGALSLDGVRLPLGGPEKARRTEVRETPERCEFVLPGKGLTVQGVVSAPRKDFVGWIYADPDGSEHHTINCSVSDMELTVSRPGESPVDLRVSGAAAYELGMRERDHGIEIQPFPDG